jgi:flavin-dependent dehydrogenase
MTRFDVIIIGAGPAGSTAARLLAKAGKSVALIEKSDFPRRKVCGEFISAATLRLLDKSGIGAAVREAAGPPVTRTAFYAGDATPKARLPGPRGKAKAGRALSREKLDTLLRDAAFAAGTHLLQPAHLLSVRRLGQILIAETELLTPSALRIASAATGTSPASADARGGGRLTLEAPIIIAASGSWNHVGPFAIDPAPRPHDLLAFKAHFRGHKLPPGLMPLLAFPGGYGGMVESDGGLLSLSCCIRRDALAAARLRHGGRAIDAVLAHITHTTRGAARALSGAVMEGAGLAAGPIRPGMRLPYKDGVFFAGNLAGEAHPVIAEGISMAIQGSALLARLLISEPDVAIAGRRYAKAWRRRFAPRLSAAALFARMAMHAPGRALAVTTVRAFPPLLTLGAKLAGKSA